jgi:hypothetical protein
MNEINRGRSIRLKKCVELANIQTNDLNSKACTAYTSSSTCSDSALMRYLD